jgi:pre-mRNA-splicing factor 18
MDLLKAEIAKKRKATEALLAKVGDDAATSIAGGIRFVRQGDLIKAREEEQLEAQRRIDAEREEKRRRREEEENAVRASKSLISNDITSSSNGATHVKDGKMKSNASSISSLTSDEIKRRLRLMGHPITLFGETDADRRGRLSKIEDEEGGNIEDEFRLNGSGSSKKQTKHSSGRHQADDEDDDDDEYDDGKPSRGPRGSSSSGAHCDGNDDDSDDDDDNGKSGGKESGRRHSSSSFDADGKRIQFSKLEPRLPAEKVVYKYFKSLLKEWEWDLNRRDDAEKMCMRGKTETKMQKQCKDYIRPLFKMCKRKTVEADILERLLRMVEHCEEGNFRAAHDEYLKAAIGNAAWPIGLTMVGIHERSGREKISTAKVAHVMNNELQRKYLTSVKRLMTFAQTKRPDVPPSMKVLT